MQNTGIKERITSIIDADPALIVQKYGEAITNYKKSRVVVELLKKDEKTTLAGCRQSVRDDARNRGTKITVAETDDLAYISDDYDDWKAEYSEALHEEAKWGATVEYLNQELQRINMLVAFARTEATLGHTYA